jgi:ethanolamine ammonia-lyase small subunit
LADDPNAVAVVASPWATLRAHTPARIALGRVGSGLPTAAHLVFQLAHAQARDAVQSGLDEQSLLEQLGPGAIAVASAAPDRATYLARPDLGRRLNEDATTVLDPIARSGPYDIVFVAGDGLSARATAANAAPLLGIVIPALRAQGWRIAPVVVATQARVALGDAVADALSARMVAVLIGERPGLSAADSMGVYLTHNPQPGRTTDAQRNCVSNIRAGGLTAEAAAATLQYLVTAARVEGRTGVALKDRRPDTLADQPSPNSITYGSAEP